MLEVEELLDYLLDHPTSSTILAAVHGVKSKYGSLKGKKWKDLDPNRVQADLSEVHNMTGMGAEPLDEQFRESMRIAAELEAQMRKKAN